MVIKKLEGFEYFQHIDGKFNVIFFTAKGNNSFNINTKEGLDNLDKVKNLFKLDTIRYGIQIHSDIVLEDNSDINEGDAIITNSRNRGLGIFTADCVPVLIIDKKSNAIAAVHSGWKGTYEEITNKTIKKLQYAYGSNPEDLEVFIGPHIRDCCYKVGIEVFGKFESKGYIIKDIAKDGKLSLENCIIQQCLKAGVLSKKIISIDYCTMCSVERKFYSYRKNKDNGRLLSLIFIKNK